MNALEIQDTIKKDGQSLYYTINATVKSHSEYKGIKSTVLTRVKLLD